MGNDQEISVWEDTTGVRKADMAGRSTLPSASLRAADFRDLIPSSDVEMIAEITPCLQLVAPVGMDIDSQDTWLEAALKALAGMPIGLLKRGAAAAMAKADHPSKIVPAIMAEVREDWDWRKRHAAPSPPRQPVDALEQHELSAEERAEVAQLMAGLARRLEANAEASAAA